MFVRGIDPVSLRATISATARTSALNRDQIAINKTSDYAELRSVAPSAKTQAPSFKDMLAQALDTVNNLQINADHMAQKLATGEAKDVHEVLMAVEEVNVGLQLTMQIRNKIIEAYQEIMRMQV